MSQLKGICLNCQTFDSTQSDAYLCAVPGHCPGLDWSKERKSKYHGMSPAERERLRESILGNISKSMNKPSSGDVV